MLVSSILAGCYACVIVPPQANKVTADTMRLLCLFLLHLSLQVCTACANSFAHGSNEVANAIGPLAAIYHVWQTSTVTSKNPVPTWLLAIGGVGIVLGVATSEWGTCLLWDNRVRACPEGGAQQARGVVVLQCSRHSCLCVACADTCLPARAARQSAQHMQCTDLNGSTAVASTIAALTGLQKRPARTLSCSLDIVCTRPCSLPTHTCLLLLPAVGYKVMRSMGVKLTRLSNSRGELRSVPDCVAICGPV